MASNADYGFLGSAPSPESFRHWGKKHGVFLHPDVGFVIATKTMGLGVYALKALKKGATVVSCSAHAALSPYPSLSSNTYDEGPAVKILQDAKHLDNVTKVVVRLMAELARQHSPWRTWLECCPLMEDHLFSLDERQRHALWQDVAAATNNVAMQLEDLAPAQKWSEARKLMVDHPEVWPEATIQTDRLFFQCLAQVLSRNFHREAVPGKDGPYLLAGVDFINHSFAHNNVEFTTRGGGRSRELTFDVVASKDIARGEQILYNYGEIVEARYLVEFQFSNLPAAAADSAKKKNILTFDAVRFSLPSLKHFIRRALANLVPDAQGSIACFPESDIDERVKFLHREGHLYDEGIFILSDESIATSLSDEKEDGGRNQGHVTGCGGVSHGFWNVVYCLTLSPEEFVNFRGKISHHWRATRTAKLALTVKTILVERMECLNRSLEGVAAAFTACPATRGGDDEAAAAPELSKVGKLLMRVLTEERRRLLAAAEGIAVPSQPA